MMLLNPALGWSATYYCDLSNPGVNSGSAGTHDDPFVSIKEVNEKTFSAGDDLYFKQGATYTVHPDDNRLVLDWGGIDASNNAIIGCYEAQNDFDCSGAKPTFDGTNTYPISDESPLIGVRGYSDVTIRDLRVINSKGYGITVKESTRSTIDNCEVDHSYRLGLGIFRSTHSTVSNSAVNDTYYWTGTGPCISISAQSAEGSSHDNLVTGNVLSNCNEGINNTRKEENSTIEYNVIYDSDYSIYIDAAKNITIRYNLIYNTASPARGRGRAISIDNENARGYCFLDGIEVYGNLIAAMTQGVFISNEYGAETDTSCNTTNVLVYNNTLVDNDINIRVARDDAGWSGNKISNNLSQLFTASTVHNSNDSPNGFTWNANMFVGIDAVGGNAAASAVVGDPKLLMTKGWRSLAAGGVNGTEFSVLLGSDAIDKGVAISNYDGRITAADFTARPIAVTVGDDSTAPEIGAWKYVAPLPLDSGVPDVGGPAADGSSLDAGGQDANDRDAIAYDAATDRNTTDGVGDSSSEDDSGSGRGALAAGCGCAAGGKVALEKWALVCLALFGFVRRKKSRGK